MPFFNIEGKILNSDINVQQAFILMCHTFFLKKRLLYKIVGNLADSNFRSDLNNIIDVTIHPSVILYTPGVYVS